MIPTIDGVDEIGGIVFTAIRISWAGKIRKETSAKKAAVANPDDMG
jgi:hypothetical protein